MPSILATSGVGKTSFFLSFLHRYIDKNEHLSMHIDEVLGFFLVVFYSFHQENMKGLNIISYQKQEVYNEIYQIFV